jgi:drug/metabolite transporter (DMT)-like permease
VPVLAGIISFFLFGDSLSSGRIAGAGIVFAGMLLARWGALRVARRARQAQASATEATQSVA